MVGGEFVAAEGVSVTRGASSEAVLSTETMHPCWHAFPGSASVVSASFRTSGSHASDAETDSALISDTRSQKYR
eukprot:scaffold324_cov394-Prasinococcus_capsulatus_cf.AAC.11